MESATFAIKPIVDKAAVEDLRKEFKCINDAVEAINEFFERMSAIEIKVQVEIQQQ